MGIFARFGQSVVVMLVGLIMVFLGLIILIGCIKAMSFLLKKMRARAEAKMAAKAPAAPAPVPAPQPEPVVEDVIEDDEEIVAVITAAIAAYAAKSDKALVVKSIRRASAWGKAGRSEQIASF